MAAIVTAPGMPSAVKTTGFDIVGMEDAGLRTEFWEQRRSESDLVLRSCACRSRIHVVGEALEEIFP
jgi:hypothetical protein